MEVFIKFDFYSAARKLAHFSCVQVIRRYEMFMCGMDSFCALTRLAKTHIDSHFFSW